MELPEPEVCYRALECRDARFDGLMYVAIQTTGIYCRPICPARTPKFPNCRFYPSAAAAQDAGFRPCLRCRPETAPDLASWRGTSNTVSRALALIAEGALDGAEASVESLADRLGLGERQLRRLFLQHLGASPISVAQTRRVLFAKQLLHDTRMSIADVALASGFTSLRRFNEVFHNLFHRPPGALRRKAKVEAADVHEGVTLRLRYKPPYDWDSLLRFFEARAIPSVEFVEDGKYCRAIQIDGHSGSIEVSHEPRRESIQVRIRFPNVHSFPAIVARVRRVFDLGADIETIDAHLAQDPMLTPLIAMRPGLRAPGGWDDFEMDAFPDTDVALLRGVAAAAQAAGNQASGNQAGDNQVVAAQAVLTAALLLDRAETWRPWRAYAAQHLWAADSALSQLRSQTSRPATQAPDSTRKEAAMSQTAAQTIPKANTLYSKQTNSPVGKLKLVASDQGLVAILWENDNPRRVRLANLIEDLSHPMLLQTEQQLEEYFAGRRTSFNVPLDMQGTPFQKNVWQALLAIPFGETRTYGDLAKQLGNPTASRAVGAANGRNPVSIVVPCHRVIGASGKLTGFAGGLETKAHLLHLEGRGTNLI